MATTESARAEAFASQADRSRATAETFARQAIETAKIIRDTKALIDRALDNISIPHRWAGTQLELLAPDGEWVTGPDLRGERGYGVIDAAVNESYHLILAYEDGTTQDAGYVRGQQGPAATVAIGTVTTVAAGSPAKVTNAGTNAAAIFNFEIPQGPVGTGNVNGPATSIADRLAVFNGTTGKLIKDGGYLVSDLLSRANHTGAQAQSTVTNLTTDLAARLLLSGGTMTGALTLFADPSLAMHAATKQYVDGLLVNMGKRGRVRAATTANITISTGLVAGQVIDGVTLVNGDQVLVKNQTTASQNGVYVVSASPARATEFDSWAEFPGSMIGVADGTANKGTLWYCTNNDGGTLGTTAITFTQWRVAGELLAANNLGDLASASAAFNNIKQAATTAATGVVKLVTAAELAAATSTTAVPSIKDVADYIASISARSWTQIGSDIPTTSGAQIDITGIPAGYRNLRVEWHGVSSSGSSGLILFMAWSSDGVTYSATTIISSSSAGSQFVNGFTDIANYDKAGSGEKIAVSCTAVATNGSGETRAPALPDGAITALRFTWSSGNFDAGYIRLLGQK